MKIPYYILLGLTVAACGGGGGHSTPAGAPGKSAYDIWLEQGNTGTYQDFLDSLVSGGGKPKPDIPGDNDIDPHWNGNWELKLTDLTNIKNAKEYLDQLGHGTASEKNMEWDSQNGYKQYTLAWLTNSKGQVYIYSEKELELGNYGVSVYNHGQAMTPYIHNKTTTPNNEYLPNKGTIFSGGTLATLMSGAPEKTTLIKGDMHFTYDPVNPQLQLIFDNYYFMSFNRKTNGTYDVKIAGINSTGQSDFNLPTGDFNKTNDDRTHFSTGYLKKDNTEEALGTYVMRFEDIDFGNTGAIIPGSFIISGAFGGTKQ